MIIGLICLNLSFIVLLWTYIYVKEKKKSKYYYDQLVILNSKLNAMLESQAIITKKPIRVQNHAAMNPVKPMDAGKKTGKSYIPSKDVDKMLSGGVVDVFN